MEGQLGTLLFEYMKYDQISQTLLTVCTKGNNSNCIRNPKLRRFKIANKPVGNAINIKEKIPINIA